MRWPGYLAGALVLGIVATTLLRRHTSHPRTRARGRRREAAAVDRHVQADALARARSEVLSGEYDMLG